MIEQSPALSRPHVRQVSMVALVALILFLLRLALIRFEPTIRALSPGCFFQKLTGFNCPGCGGTRAFFAFLRGDLRASLHLNPLFLIGLLMALFSLFLWLMDRTQRGRPRVFRGFHMTARAGWVLGGLLIAFWILRNIPVWPFVLLSPP